MTTTIHADLTVKDLIKERPGRSRVFEQHGIEYCCSGGKTLAEACAEEGLDPVSLIKVLVESEEGTLEAGHADVGALGLAELATHIVDVHHAYLRAELPRLLGLVEKVARVHGGGDARLHELERVLTGFIGELGSHMQKEERILFPAITQLEQRAAAVRFPFGSLANPIQTMEEEHDGAGDALGQMRRLTEDFTPPRNACNTYRAMLDGLRELEADMHQHVHEENNVLFPKALELEAARV